MGDIEDTAGARVAAVAAAEQRSAIGSLRRDAYLSAREFRALRPVAYEWSDIDSRATVLAVWDESGAPLATMCGVVAATRADAEANFECAIPAEVGHFPALLLCRAATHADHRAEGLNSLLRYYFIQAAWRGGLGSMMSLFFQGAPRLRLLETLGYQMKVLPNVTWESVVPHKSPLLGSLARERMVSASASLEELLDASLKRYPWRGPPLVLPGPAIDRPPRAAATEPPR